MNKAPEGTPQNDELEKFVYKVSHELQEQVRNISNFTGLLAKHQGSTTDEVYKYHLSIVTESAAVLNEQLAALLIYSRIGQSADRRPVDCQQIVEDILHRVQTKNVNIVVGKLPMINGNPSEIKLIFESVISNALKFSRKGTKNDINIQCRRTENYWEFSVNDSGIGINTKYASKIFDIFQRLNSSDEYSGLGTGLAYAKKAVEKHLGKIWLETEMGKGTIFYFTIPII